MGLACNPSSRRRSSIRRAIVSGSGRSVTGGGAGWTRSCGSEGATDCVVHTPRDQNRRRVSACDTNASRLLRSASLLRRERAGGASIQPGTWISPRRR